MINETPICKFTPLAWEKIRKLINGFDSEIGWHALTERTSDNEICVADIFVYPQTVSAVTTTTDDAEYAQWLNNLPDEVFNNLHFHGHSHVDMGVCPSSVDLAHRQKIIEQLSEDDYYIFGIFNKQWKGNLTYYGGNGTILKMTAALDTPDNQLKQFIDDARCKVKT